MAEALELFDLVIIGGGVNGAGIARDAAGRGLSVFLCEKDDLAAHTSSASTKLIHGGLRYLEYYEFRLVRKALMEREILLKSAPHIMWPMRFVMPHDPSTRPAWMIRLGLFLYDHLARRAFLAKSESVRLATHPAGAPLRPGFKHGFVYSDGWVDDARLVTLCAVDARDRGAVIRTRTRCTGAERHAEHWVIGLTDPKGSPYCVQARAVVNAAGPWVADVLARELKTRSDHKIRLVKGSHIVVKRLFDHPYAYIFQNPDRRIIFAIPYEADFTLIGTTDIEYQGDPNRLAIDAQETEYLCAMASRYFKRTLTSSDVVRSYSGVRPLLEDDATDASAVTRDYWLELNREGAPALSVFGGKITTFRRLAEEAMELLLPALGAHAKTRAHWTSAAILPGGDLHPAQFDSFCTALGERHPWLPNALARRYARAYGSRVSRLLGQARTLADLGEEVAPGVFEKELIYLRGEEWAMTGDDVLWRRSKLGLHLDAAGRIAVTAWMDSQEVEIALSTRNEVGQP